MSQFVRSIDNATLTDYVARQLNATFPDGNDVSPVVLQSSVDEAMTRLYDCFREIRKKYYWDGTNTLFNHLNSDHYAMFLYLLSNTVARSGRDEALASKLFLLNKALHGLDAFYGVALPQVFLFVHPVGTVLGNAKYGNYFVCYQNCGVGALEDGRYPEFGEGVVMFAKSAVLGGCRVGSNVVFGANSFLLQTDVPDGSTVVGAYPQHRLLANPGRVIDRLFR